MSSESRSNSAVRNLRSIFEDRRSDNGTSPLRGRSPNGLGSDKENNYQSNSKVRANFVSVEPAPSMAAAVESAGGRRSSFVEAEADLELKKTISKQQGDLSVPEVAVESMPPSVAATPLKPSNFGQLGHNEPAVAANAELEPENPDKLVTGAEEEAGDMKPADPADETAVSGGQALPPVAEDMRSVEKSAPSSTKATKTAEAKRMPGSAKPAAISTKSTTKPASSSVKSPSSQPKTLLSGKAPSFTDSPAAKRPPRSSLTAPTASSMARSGSTSDKQKTSPPAKTKAREATKPVNLPSHLMAPTAASKAKHDSETTEPAASLRTSLASRSKPQAPPRKAAQRASLASNHRPESPGSTTSGRRSMAAVDGSFLDRMTRPTAASSGHRTERTAAKVPQKSKTSTKPKVNGHVSNPAATNQPEAATEATTAQSTDLHKHEPEVPKVSGVSLAGGATTIGEAMAAVQDTGEGNATPDHRPLEQVDGAMEATPAGLGGDEMIR